MMKEKVSGGILNVKKLGETLVLRGKKALKEKEGMNYALWMLAGFLSSGLVPHPARAFRQYHLPRVHSLPCKR